MAQSTSVSAPKKEKELSIETLRGLAILLVVAGYIVQDDLARAADPSAFSSSLKFIYYLFTPIRMPLFTVISAYLYASFPATRATFKKLISGKARRILIPFAVISAVQYAVFSFVPVDGPQLSREIYKVYILPYEQLWFLYSIFWIFVLVGAMDAARLMETPKKWLAWLVAALVIHETVHMTRLFSITGVNYLFPFFLMGYGIKRFQKQLFSSGMIRAYFFVAFAAYAVHVVRYIDPALTLALPAFAHRLVVLAITFSAVPLIFHYRKSVPFLAKIGSYAFGIYLFNKIGLVPIKVLFTNLGIRNDVAVFSVYLLGSVSAAIGIQLVLERYAFTRMYVLGLKEPAAASSSAKNPARWSALSFPNPATLGLVFAGVLVSAVALFAGGGASGLASRTSDMICKATGAYGPMKSGCACRVPCRHCRGTLPPRTA